ncbi:preprotein translocase subunit SecD [Methanosphaera sp. ISO3-F5]|uniref:preprotein translocase subunit SecD n=1 Tax=Methanosphaera sp. ISO3-F5 TaxID=1452353 RepID=UPI002B263B4E|nr:preprotein translocase subunit SecD [Methanosphaera sp. ISO3-F5]WQH63384.1 preprotein translocase subunit SecD [Methanosphaera sp. ISO3-F5]
MVTIKPATKQFLKRPRTILLAVLLIVSIASIGIFGLQEGLDLDGGSMIQLHLEEPVDQDTMNTVTAVLDKRLNAFGISDVQVRQSGDQDVIVEIAGVRPEEVERIISTPGKFEAKINNKTALTGADISTVSAAEVTGTRWKVPFSVSLDASNKFAEVAKGQAGAEVQMFLDDKLISSPQLDAGLANGVGTTDIEVSGGEQTKEQAQQQATEIHTVLESGALPVKLSISGVNSVSAELGSQFETGSLIAGFLALLAIVVIVSIKYRSPSLVIPIVFTSLSELVLILGFASIVHWNLDLSAIAGMIATIGTGVDDQIVMTDEVLARRDRSDRKNIVKTRIKDAFFIVYASAGTLIAAMLPLAYIGFARGATGIGMLTGFAVTTVVGVIIGIFVTRPVFADYMETFLVKNPREEISINKSSSKPKKNKKKGRKTIAREEAEKKKKR